MSYCVDGKLILANLNTLETAEKTVVETYVRKVDKLVHLTINGEEIVTTDNHPFYVQGRGFIEAGSLLIGDKLVSANGEDLFVEDYSVELTEEPVSVYNFQVDDFHTYFVGDCEVWVHNVDCVKATELKTIKRDSNEWKAAIEKMKAGGKDNNFRVESATDAKALLQEARGNMNRYKRYDPRLKQSGKGYSFHPNESNTANAPHNNLPHIKWVDNTGAKGKGHIFFNCTN